MLRSRPTSGDLFPRKRLKRALFPSSSFCSFYSSHSDHAWRSENTLHDQRRQSHRGSRESQGVPDLRLRVVRWYLLRLRLWIYQRCPRLPGVSSFSRRPRSGCLDFFSSIAHRLHPLRWHLLRCHYRWRCCRNHRPQMDRHHGLLYLPGWCCYPDDCRNR